MLSPSRIRKFVRLITTTIAALQLLLPMVVLYFVADQAMRLVALVGFTAVFCIGAAIGTTATKYEIMAATAA